MATKENSRRAFRLLCAYWSRLYELSETHPRATHRLIFSVELIVITGMSLAIGVALISGVLKGIEWSVGVVGQKFLSLG
jgi:hypothetical protein